MTLVYANDNEVDVKEIFPLRRQVCQSRLENEDCGMWESFDELSSRRDVRKATFRLLPLRTSDICAESPFSFGWITCGCA